MKAFFRRIVYALANRFAIVTENAQEVCLARSLKSCGQNVSLHMPVRIHHVKNVEIGDNVSIAPFVHMWGGGGIKIGSRVLIGSHTEITSESHDSYKRSMYGTHLEREVIIEDGVWISSHCVILPGVTIGEGSLIGAGAVVASNVKPYSVVVTGRKREEWRRPLVGERREDGQKSAV